MTIIMTNQNSVDERNALVASMDCNLDNETEVSRICNDAVAQALQQGRSAVFIGWKGNEPQSYAVNTICDSIDSVLEGMPNQPAAQQLEFIVPFNGVLSDEFIDELEDEINRPHVVTKKQSFGDYGDPLKGEFKQFKATLPHQRSFVECLFGFMRERDMTSPDVYKAAGVSKSVFSRIGSFDDPRHPKKETVAALVIGLQLNIDEAQELYNSAGYYLGYNTPTDRIIRFFIDKRIYDIDEVNYCLLYYGLPILGEKPRESRHSA